MLEVRDLGMRFGGLQAVNGVSLDVNDGEIVSIIGPNGAGKRPYSIASVAFYPTSGTVKFRVTISHLPGLPDLPLGHGAYFQHVRLFGRMTAVKTCLSPSTATPIPTCLPACSPRRPIDKGTTCIGSRRLLAEKVDLLSHANREAGTLSYGQQRRLEIARCMVTEPNILMLDEPAAGLNPRNRDLDELITAIKSSATTCPFCSLNMTWGWLWDLRPHLRR